MCIRDRGRSSNACAISMKSPLVSAGHTCKRGAACVRTSFDISPNLKLNCQEPKLARSYELARIKPSRLRRGSTGFSASSLLTEKRRLPVAAGAARPAVGSAEGLVQDVVDPHLASGRTEAVHDAVAPPAAKLASVGATPCVELDAFARATTLRADPANRRLPVRAGRRERAE